MKHLSIEAILTEINIMRPDLSGIAFSPSSLGKSTTINPFELKNPPHNYMKNNVGNVYHILLYKLDKRKNIINPDLFEATLSCPKTYLSNIIKFGFYGMIVKKTKKKDSREFVKFMFNEMSTGNLDEKSSQKNKFR